MMVPRLRSEPTRPLGQLDWRELIAIKGNIEHLETCLNMVKRTVQSYA